MDPDITQNEFRKLQPQFECGVTHKNSHGSSTPLGSHREEAGSLEGFMFFSWKWDWMTYCESTSFCSKVNVAFLVFSLASFISIYLFILCDAPLLSLPLSLPLSGVYTHIHLLPGDVLYLLWVLTVRRPSTDAASRILSQNKALFFIDLACGIASLPIESGLTAFKMEMQFSFQKSPWKLSFAYEFPSLRVCVYNLH